MFKKYFLQVVVLGTALLAISCEENKVVGVIFVTPTSGRRVSPDVVTVKVRWYEIDCVAESVALRVDGVHVGTNTSSPVPETCSFTWDATNVLRGSRPTLTATLYYSFLTDNTDRSYREVAESIKVLVDTGGPDVRIASPQDGDTLTKGNVPITAWARDTSAAGMVRVEYMVDEVLIGTASSGDRDTWRYTWDASQASAGNHTVKAKAYNGFAEMAVASVGIWLRDSSSGGGPTYHHGYVDTSETWSPSGNPHIVDGDVKFRNGAWLTVEPGCVVRFDNRYQLDVGYYGPSGLKAIGTAAAPILFTSNQASPAPGDWKGLVFGDSTQAGARLEYCTIEYGGYGSSFGAGIEMYGKGQVEEISNCTIRQSSAFGVYCMDSSSFGSFHDNVVTANRSYALHVEVGLAELLDASNTLTGNDSAGVEMYGVVTVSTTWPNLGVPYIIGKVTVGDSLNNPVLTIAPGVEIRFRQQGWLNAGMYLWHIPGRIMADGSAGRIRFTSTAASPAPGDFGGVGVYPGPSDESEFRDCDFAYGGGTGGDNALLLVYDRRPAITGCDFGPSAGWGITFRTAQATDTVGLRVANTFHDYVGGDVNWIYTPPSPGD